MHATLSLRLARSAVFTVVCVALGIAAHLFAGGAAPTAWKLLLAGSVVLAVTTAAAGRERSPRAVIALLLAGQVFIHQVLGPSGASAAGVHGHRPGGLPMGGGLGVSVGMLLAHLAAALLTGWWLACGETALWSLLGSLGGYAVRRLRTLLSLLWRRTAPPPATRAARAVRVIRPARLRLLEHSLDGRGPPVLHVL